MLRTALAPLMPVLCSTVSSAQPCFYTNLLVDPGAEIGPAANDTTSVVTPTAWTTTGSFTAATYGAASMFPALDSGVHGSQFFAGGPHAAVSTAEQLYALDPSCLQLIDAGVIVYQINAYLGGYGREGDNAALDVVLRDALPASLAGQDNITIILIADGQNANPVNVTIQ